jgi:hypothetical protein
MNDAIDEFRITKKTGTHGDIFAAVGLAELLATIPGIGNVRMVDGETAFRIHPPRSLDHGDISNIPHTPGYLYLRPNNNSSVPSSVLNYVDYPRELERVDRYFKQREDLRKKKTADTEIAQLLQNDQPREDWDLWRALNILQGDETSNRVHLAILRMSTEEFRIALKNGLDSIRFGTSSGLKWDITQSMVFFPTSAKGYREIKPTGTKRRNFKVDEWGDPFFEWLKYRGYFATANPRLLRKDVRILVPNPSDISIQALVAVARELRKVRVYGGPPKMDALAVLRLAEILVRHSVEFHDAAAEIFPGLSLKGKSPAQAISGIMVTHYQSLGNAKAVSAMSTIALPGWFSLESRENANDLLKILDEHQRVVRGLQDDHSDEIGLLIGYRRFLERRGDSAISSLIEFMEMYGAFVMRANGTTLSGRKRWVTRFTDESFRRLLMGTNEHLLGIIDDSGFEAVARAVRQATVSSQNKRARGDDVWRDIRYELLHDLHRTRKVPGSAFVECIMEFVSRYNYENARRRETKRDPKAAPASVSDEELKSFIVLVECHGTSLVGALLAAYGSCKEKWEPEDTGDI